MNIILFGAPGAGKGTQARALNRKYGIPKLTTGNILRDAIENKSPLGLMVKSFVDEGELVPDDIAIKLINERLGQSDCANGFILDGFPRTLAQAASMNSVLLNSNKKIQHFIYLDVPRDMLASRITGRMECKDCYRVYNIHTKPGLQNNTKCTCGGELDNRIDDDEPTVKNRIKTYFHFTDNIKDFYADVLREIDGSKDKDTVTEEIFKIIEK